ILCLGAGVNDYITKPFPPRLLVARLKAVLRRTSPKRVEEAVEGEGLMRDPASHRVTAQGNSLDVGPTEDRLLQFYMTQQERA
ncbi:DNA-binding response regulator, partial [Cobetia sp. SIMBA_158]